VVLVIATGTLWILFSMWLVFPYLEMPRMLCGAAACLMWLEFIALTGWGLASESCDERPCGVLSETLRAAAGLDLPALAGVVFVLSGAEIARQNRRARRRMGDVADRPRA
jgi:hypothetical protein